MGCLASANNLVEEVRRLGGAHAPLVILLDTTMSGRDPFDAMSQLAQEFPQTRTIVFSGHDDPAFVDRAIDAGAWGCISKNDLPERSWKRCARSLPAAHSFRNMQIHKPQTIIILPSPEESPCHEPNSPGAESELPG